ncbi:MAG TPA: hypothetical protein P5084_08005 [Paludibacter sp.]|nr:hypothetical protein [Paludibacter sp.]
MKRTILLLIIVGIIPCVFGQSTVKKVNTKYFRPAITSLFFQPRNAYEEVLVNKFKNLELNTKFDNHKIDFPCLANVTTLDFQKNQKIKSYLQLATNPIMAKWWNRDADGNFNFLYVAERGLYTATDADAMISRSSSTNRIEMLGEQLIDKSYILVYEITELYTMEDYYNKVDAQNKKKSNYTPVKRTDEGFVANYNVYAYKMNFNDSVSNIFYSDYWVDKKNHDIQKVAKWASATFPVKYVATVSGTARSTQPKDPKNVAYLNKKKKTSNELIEDMPVDIQTNAIFELSRKIEDFRLKVTVYKAYPVTAKLGTKEGLYIDQRFYVYEIEQEKNGNQKTNRMGVVRAKKIMDNKKVASGVSKPSVFQQVNGKRLYEGMFMESKEDYGLIANIGGTASSYNSLGGFYIGADYRISKFANISELHLGLDISMGSMKNIYPGQVETETSVLTSSGDYLSGSTSAIAVTISKENYYSKLGNMYVKPSIGFGVSAYSFTEFNGSTISESYKKDYSWSSLYMPVSVGIGWNVTPLVSLEYRPGFFIRFAATTGNSDSLHQYSTSYTDGWGFQTIDKMGLGTFGIFQLRLRF